MNRQEILKRMTSCGVVAVMRGDDPELLIDAARAIAAGGVMSIEITMTVPGAIDTIGMAAERLEGDILVGVGSVTRAEEAIAAMEAGAQFVVSPVFKPEVIDAAHANDKPVVPGAFTPTEILAAWEAGADVVKVFPGSVGGPAYIKAVKAPMPFLKLSPTGGVTVKTAADFIHAGAEFLGAGSALVEKKALAQRDFDRLTDLARQFAGEVRLARRAI